MCYTVCFIHSKSINGQFPASVMHCLELFCIYLLLRRSDPDSTRWPRRLPFSITFLYSFFTQSPPAIKSPFRLCALYLLLNSLWPFQLHITPHSRPNASVNAPIESFPPSPTQHLFVTPHQQPAYIISSTHRIARDKKFTKFNRLGRVSR